MITAQQFGQHVKVARGAEHTSHVAVGDSFRWIGIEVVVRTGTSAPKVLLFSKCYNA